jgi:hypothetical protein
MESIDIFWPAILTPGAPSKGPVTHLVIDSTGSKFTAKVSKNGKEKRSVWRKLHLAVDGTTHVIVAAETSLENIADAHTTKPVASQDSTSQWRWSL